MDTHVFARGSARVSNDGCVFWLYRNSSGYWHISALITEVSMRRKGYATALLRRVTKWADRVGVELRLTCAPFGPGCLSLKDTRRFYEKLGFKIGTPHEIS